MKKVALIVGHSQSAQGAVNSTFRVSEFEFNKHLVNMVKKLLDEKYENIETVVVYRDTYAGLPAKVNTENPDVAVSFHANAYNGSASGTETLYWGASSKGKRLAEILQKNIRQALPMLADRKIKPKRDGDRGAPLLKGVNAPCVILEPFFIDNDTDFQTAHKLRAPLAESIAFGINQFLTQG